MSRFPLRVIASFVLAAGAASPAVARDLRDTIAEARWEAIHQSSHAALAALSPLLLGADCVPDTTVAWPQPYAGAVRPPLLIVVGFTGGLEGSDSPVSGVVRIRRSVGEHFGDAAGVTALTYNNFRWREAAAAVRDLARHARGGESNADSPQTGALGTPVDWPQPLIVVYGHSWGAGSIAKFARALRQDNLDISFAMYIDAFTRRTPRVPDNIRYAVNICQRKGILHGLPLRGKKKLRPESAEHTIVLGSHRITPETDHFGWHWNMVQPLLYRHPHRISHDVRLQRYLREVISLKLALGRDPTRETVTLLQG